MRSLMTSAGRAHRGARDATLGVRGRRGTMVLRCKVRHSEVEHGRGQSAGDLVVLAFIEESQCVCARMAEVHTWRWIIRSTDISANVEGTWPVISLPSR